jgi:hypothetical protein
MAGSFNPPHPVEDVHILLAGFALAILHRGYRILVHGFDVFMLGGLVRQTAEWRIRLGRRDQPLLQLLRA